MKTAILCFLLLFSVYYAKAQEPSFSEEWTTYTNNGLSVVGADVNTGIAVDTKNNIYLIEGTNANNQNIPLGSLSKFSPDGQLLWTTASLGRTFGLTIDHNGDIIIAGYTVLESGIATPGTFQENFGGGNTDAFLMKYDANGNRIWGTYYGGSENERTMYSAETYFMGLEVDSENNIFWTFGTLSEGMATDNVFQTQIGGLSNIIAAFNTDGQRLWATYYGTDKAHRNSISGLQIGESGIYVAGYVHNRDIENSYYDTSGNYVFQAERHAVFISKFDFTGNRVWSYYMPQGNGQNYSLRDALLLADNHLYLTYGTSSTDIGTPGTAFPVIDNTLASEFMVNRSGVLAKLDLEGNLIWTTYLSGVDPAISLISTNMAAEDNGVIDVMAKKIAHENDVIDGYFPELENTMTYYIISFNENGEFVAGSYLGKNNTNLMLPPYEMALYRQGICFYGSLDGTHNIASEGAFQDTPLEGQINSFLSKYKKNTLSIDEFESLGLTIYPNPTSSVLHYTLDNGATSPLKIEVYNDLGQRIKTEIESESVGTLHLSPLSPGVYFVTFKAVNKTKSTTKKIIVL